MVFTATVPLALRDQLAWVPGSKTEAQVCGVGSGSCGMTWTSHGWLLDCGSILITEIAKLVLENQLQGKQLPSCWKHVLLWSNSLIWLEGDCS